MTSMPTKQPAKPRSRKTRRILVFLGIVLMLVFLISERLALPVAHATRDDWNKNSFWYEPWGASGVHKGIDIFAPKGQAVMAASGGLVAFQGRNRLGGNVILILGPKWRFHYYAHLDSATVSTGEFVRRGYLIGTVGDSGNAADKPPHLHYVILSVFPHPWLFDKGTQGWKRMFYLNPGERLEKAVESFEVSSFCGEPAEGEFGARHWSPWVKPLGWRISG